MSDACQPLGRVFLFVWPYPLAAAVGWWRGGSPAVSVPSTRLQRVQLAASASPRGSRGDYDVPQSCCCQSSSNTGEVAVTNITVNPSGEAVSVQLKTNACQSIVLQQSGRLRADICHFGTAPGQGTQKFDILFAQDGKAYQQQLSLPFVLTESHGLPVKPWATYQALRTQPRSDHASS